MSSAAFFAASTCRTTRSMARTVNVGPAPPLPPAVVPPALPQPQPITLLSPFPGGSPLDMAQSPLPQEFGSLLQSFFPDLLAAYGVQPPPSWFDGASNTRIPADVIEFFEEFNKVVADPPARRSFHNEMRRIVDNVKDRSGWWKCVRVVLEMCHTIVVPDETVLRTARYGEMVYGATSYEQIHSMAMELELGDEDTIIDLGSGIGNVVCCWSGDAKVKKAVGIELDPRLAAIASTHQKLFAAVMSWFGAQNIAIDLHHGSITDTKFEQLITTEANVIYVNNRNFQLLMPDLLKLFSQCRNGTRIVSTDPLIGNRANKASKLHGLINPLFKIATSSQLKDVEKNASWQSKTCQFYLTTIHRSD